MSETDNTGEELENDETLPEIDIETLDMDALGATDDALTEAAEQGVPADEIEDEEEILESEPEPTELLRQEITTRVGDLPSLVGKMSDLMSLQNIFILKMMSGTPLTPEEQQMAQTLLAKIESGEITLPFAAKGLNAEQVIAESSKAFNAVSEVFRENAESE